MQKSRAVLGVLTFAVVSLGATQGAFAVMSTIHTYSGVCAKLDGFPGLLQSAGFVPRGGCKESDGGGPADKCREGLCSLNGKVGRCTTVVIKKKSYCECQVKVTSH